MKYRVEWGKGRRQKTEDIYTCLDDAKAAIYLAPRLVSIRSASHSGPAVYLTENRGPEYACREEEKMHGRHKGDPLLALEQPVGEDRDPPSQKRKAAQYQYDHQQSVFVVPGVGTRKAAA